MKQRNLWKENRPTLLTGLVKSQSSGVRTGAVLQVPRGHLPTQLPPPGASAQSHQDTSSLEVLVRLCRGLHPFSTHFSEAGAGTKALAVCLKPIAKAINPQLT